MLKRIVTAITKAPRQALILLVKAYRYLMSPWLGCHCRFEPSCSCYALESLKEFGCWRGLALITWRLLRCHPLCRGGYDPVPQKQK